MKKRATKIFIYAILTCAFVIGLIGIFYKWGLPELVNCTYTENLVEKIAKKATNTDINIVNMKLSTGMEIAFTIDKFTVDKNHKNYLTLSNIDILISLRELYKKNIIVKKVLAENVYIDAYNLTKIFPQEEKKKEKRKSPVHFDFYNTLLGVKNVKLIYHSPDFDIDLGAKHAIFDRTGDKKFLHVDFNIDAKKQGHKINIFASDQNRIYMENHVAYIKDFPIIIEDSTIIINAFMTNKGIYELNISAKKFNAKDISDIIRSNLVVANGRQMLEPIKDIEGNVDFDVKIAKDNLQGNINVNEVNFKIISLLDMPIKVTKGKVNIGNNDIEYSDFEGYYNNKKTNTLSMKGYTKDYKKTCDTKLDADIFVTNDFFKNYLSKMLGSPIELVGDSMSKLILKSVNGSVDILWFFLLRENHGFKFGGQPMILNDYKTFFKADLSIIKNILKINTINYHITKELKRGMTPLVQLNGNIDMADNMKILDLDVNMPRPLPSEFLNFIICQKIFKKGMVSGHMHYDNNGAVPFLKGAFEMDKVFLPAQRLYIRSAKLLANGNKVDLKTEGRFRREQYKFDGYILNDIRLPIIVKDVNLTLDNIDLEKVLEQKQSDSEIENPAQAFVMTGAENEEESEIIPPFPKGLIVIEKCSLILLKGIYKEIAFGNIHANMTLDKNGILNLKSNRFDIADGHSSLRVTADLINRKYNVKLGVKEVNSDTMASAILGLPNQISGRAKGFLDLSTDETLKLNGSIKFNIKDGSIGQVGYVEYVLKVASLFRNPLAMISPSILADLVTVPDGIFDNIQGEMTLEDNIIKRMKITSTAPELTTLIFGRYNLSTNDATLRIYTKITDKGKGFAGALRNISLNSIASKLPTSARNEGNYYANELSMIPTLESGEERAQVFLTKIDGDLINYNFLSSLKRIK